MNRKLLVIDDDEINCRLMATIFKAEGLDVVAAHDGITGLQRAATEAPDAVLLDLKLPGMSGIEVLQALKANSPRLPVLMLTASLDVQVAVQTIKAGAADYLTKPVDPEELVLVVQRALETRALRREVEELRRHVGHPPTDLAVQMGPSEQVSRVAAQVNVVAASDFTVLVVGETGTGKELVTQAIHHLSARRRKPFVALDCGAIPEALLESEWFGHEKGAFTGADHRKPGRLRLAEGGTCLLDEVGNLPTSLQPKLLRVLESRQLHPVGAEEARPIDVRFLAATNDDLQARVVQGTFRADLYFRLAQYTISLPPLRERPEDVPYLAQRFLDEASVELRRPVDAIDAEALDVLERHAWPGNVRELRNVIRHAVLHTEGIAIGAETVRATLGAGNQGTSVTTARATGQSLKEAAEQAARGAERQIICETLRATNGNKAEAARALKTDYKTLHVKMKTLGIRAQDFAM